MLVADSSQAMLLGFDFLEANGEYWSFRFRKLTLRADRRVQQAAENFTSVKVEAPVAAEVAKDHLGKRTWERQVKKTRSKDELKLKRERDRRPF